MALALPPPKGVSLTVLTISPKLLFLNLFTCVFVGESFGFLGPPCFRCFPDFVSAGSLLFFFLGMDFREVLPVEFGVNSSSSWEGDCDVVIISGTKREG